MLKFDPKDYEDRYETALKDMIREKLKGHKPIIADAPERGNVVNLMDALKASLSETKPPAKSRSKRATKAAEPAERGARCCARRARAAPRDHAAHNAYGVRKATSRPSRGCKHS